MNQPTERKRTMTMQFGDPKILAVIESNGDNLESSARIKFVQKKIGSLYDKRREIISEASEIEDAITRIDDEMYGDKFEKARLQDEYRKLEDKIDVIENEIAELKDELNN